MSERRKRVVVLIISALFIIGTMVGTAAAQRENDMPPITEHKAIVDARRNEAKRMMLLMDTNKDGKVSKEEWMGFMEREFDRLDTNHDGFVDVKDMEKSQFQVRHGAVGK
jgi:predicted nucleotidyltransferase